MLRLLRRYRVQLGLLVALTCALTGVHRTSLWLEARARQSLPAGEVGPLPDGRVLRVLSLGFERLVADLFWLRTVYYVGDEESTRAGYPAAPRLAGLVTDIDPEFTTVYVLMNSVIAVLMRQPEQAVALLEKGIRHNDHYWKLHFHQGFNLFYEMSDYERAAHHMRAAFERGGPKYLSLLASRLYAEAGAPETAMAFLEARLKGEQSLAVRRQLGLRYYDLWVTRDLARIDAALAEYERERGRRPESLDALVDGGFLIPEPRDPDGEAYFIADGRGATRYAHETLRVYRQGGGA
jgi:tetratricopeptide (TPR) repeat protein